MKYFILSLPFLCLLFLFSCRNSPKVDTQKAQITILGENAATIQAMMALENQYEMNNSNIDLDFKPNSYDDAFGKANQDFANGTGLYDIVMQYNFSLSSFVRNNYVYPMDELLKDIPDSLKAFEKDIFPYAWKEVGYYYKNWQKPSGEMIKVGYPWASNTMLLMYNKSMFDDIKQKQAYKKKYNEELQVPITWEQFFRVAEFFTQPENKTNGVCLQGAAGGWVYFEWMNFLFGMGGKMMQKEYGWQGDGNTKILLNTPEALKAVKLYRSLKPFNAGNYTNVEQTEQMKIMMAGKTAMSIVWSDLIFSSIKTTNGFNSNYGFAPIPGNVSILAGGAFFINRKTKNPKESMRYIVDLMQPKMQIEMAKRGLCSSLKSVYDDIEVQKIPYTNALKTSLNRGVYTLEAGPDANMISEKVTNYMQKVWNDEETPEQALIKLQAEIESERKIIFGNLKK
jgi:ABC-type glycerol-3-phosphate transport system substrate-binding protein